MQTIESDFYATDAGRQHFKVSNALHTRDRVAKCNTGNAHRSRVARVGRTN